MAFSKTYKQTILINLGLLIILVLVTTAITTFYISNEKFIYFWDYSRSEHLTSDLATYFLKAKRSSILSVLGSLSDNYNKLY